MEKILKLFKKSKCPNCHEYNNNTNYSWCQTCDPRLLTEGWTSGNETIDEIIKNTQLKAAKYDNSYYLQWISYDELKDVKKIKDGVFATTYHATWINSWKYIDDNNKKRL